MRKVWYVLSNLNSNLLRFHCAHPSLHTVLIYILCPQAFSTTKLTCEIPKRGYGNDWYVLTMYVDSLKVNHAQKTLYYKVFIRNYVFRLVVLSSTVLK